MRYGQSTLSSLSRPTTTSVPGCPAGSLLGLESAADIFHEQHKVKFVCGAWLELRYEMYVEVSGVGGFAVDAQAAGANVVR